MRARIREVRRFERFYSRRLKDSASALRIHEAQTAMLAILEELSDTAGGSAAWLCGRLDMDAGYVSRTLRLMALHKDVRIVPSTRDGRMKRVELTESGRRIGRFFEGERERQIGKILEELPPRQQDRLVRAMKAIRQILQLDSQRWLNRT